MVRAVLGVALLVGGGSGTALFTADTTLRYKSDEAARDFKLRDQRIGYIEKRIESMSVTLRDIDESHPPPELIKDIDKLEDRLDYIVKRIQEESREAEQDLNAHEAKTQHWRSKI